MSFQSEAELENWLINELHQQFGYSYYKQIEDKEILEDNFRTNLYNLNKEDLNNLPFTDTEFDRILTYLKDKSVYQSAKQLRDKYVLEREDGSKVHIKFLDYDDYSNLLYLSCKDLYENYLQEFLCLQFVYNMSIQTADAIH